MNNHRAFYSLVQYCPDRSRAESVNIGVVLFCPDPRFLGIRLAENHTRLRKVFGVYGRKLDSLKLAERAMRHRIESGGEIVTVENLHTFIETRGNDLRLVEPRVVKVDDAHEELDRLFSELVVVETATESVAARLPAKKDSLPPALANVFSRLLTTRRVWKPGRIEPIRGRRIEVPYAYQNGAVNLVKPTTFRPGKGGETQAANLAVDGDLINRHGVGGKQSRLIVVSSHEGPKQAKDISEHVAPLFKEYGVRLVRPDQVEEFAREVEQTAH